MATTPEYEIKDIKITPDGNNFRVVVQSDFVVDEFGQRKDEMFQFPIKLLNDQDKWKSRINSVMIKRAVDEEDEDALDTTTPAGGFVQLSATDKRLNRITRLQAIKSESIGTVSIKDQVQTKKQVRALENGALQKATDTETTAATRGKKNDSKTA